MLYKEVYAAFTLFWVHFWRHIFHTYRSPKNRDGEKSVSGRIVLITGANAGLGKGMALEMAKRGAIVIMACRNMEKAERAREDIINEVPSAQLHLVPLDLGDLASVREMVKVVKGNFDHIDILINNGGVMEHTLKRTKDGFESNFGVNYLGHFLLTLLLLDHLKKGAPSRIVMASSLLHRLADLDLDDLHWEKRSSFGFIQVKPYATSKLAVILFVMELSKRLQGSGVNVYALCPGAVKTDLSTRDGSYVTRFFASGYNLIGGVKVTKGIETALYCCLSEECENESGFLYRFRARWNRAYNRIDRTVIAPLWKISEELVNFKYEDGNSVSVANKDSNLNSARGSDAVVLVSSFQKTDTRFQPSDQSMVSIT